MKAKGNRVPVVFAAVDEVTGVKSLGCSIKEAMAQDDQYEIILLNAGKQRHGKESGFDYWAPTADAARSVLKSLSPAIVIPNWMNELYALCAELNGVGHELRCIGVCHATSEDEYYRPLSYYEPIITRFLAVSNECRSGLSEYVEARRADIRLLQSPVAVPVDLSRSYSTEPVRLTYAGRMVQRQKRVLDFVALIRELDKTDVSYRFELVGEGPDSEDLKAALVDYGAGSHVVVRDPVPRSEMPAIWANTDIFVQASDYEGLSISLLEAMAHGAVPVITDAGSGIRSVIEEGVNGYVVPAADMATMASRITALCADGKKLAEIGRQAHEKALDFRVEKYAIKFRDLLDEVLAAPIRSWPGDKPMRSSDISLGMEVDAVQIELEALKWKVASLMQDVSALEELCWHSPWLRLENRIRRHIGRRRKKQRGAGGGTP